MDENQIRTDFAHLLTSGAEAEEVHIDWSRAFNVQAESPVAPCCDLGKDDPTGDEDGIVIAVCEHRLDGDFERYWDDNEDEVDAKPIDPAKPLIYVSAVKWAETDEFYTLPFNGCDEDNCPETRLCQTHYADI